MQNVATAGRKLCDRYTLTEKLGAGGQGEVWRARDEQLGADVALKVVSVSSGSEEAWAALQQQLAIARELAHESILSVYRPLRSADVAVLPMELAPGGDLRRLRGADYLESVPILIAVARALQHAHSHGVVHRDLKPGNVLFDAQGRVKLADFAAPGELSPFTASPQQLRGEPPTVADDVYGLGALAYELLSGYPPFYPRFEARRVLEEPVPELQPVHPAPPRLTRLVTAMLSKQPAERPASMAKVLVALEAALSDTMAVTLKAPECVAPASEPQPPPVVTVSAPPRSEQRASERHLLAPSLLLAGLAALALGAFVGLPRIWPAGAHPQTGTAPSDAPAPAAASEDRLREQRAAFDARLAALDERAAGVWGGADYAAAKRRESEALTAAEAGDASSALQSLAEAQRLLDSVEGQAAKALALELQAGERALAAGDPAAARQAFEYAHRIEPAEARADSGLKLAHSLEQALPLIADALHAESGKQYDRALHDYRQALALDTGNARARAGLERASAALRAESYARSIGAGSAALDAGRLAEARAAFVQARKLKPGGAEATQGLARVAAASRSLEFAAARSTATALEAQERWAEAAHEYAAVLKRDPSVSFALQGRARAAARAELAERLQALIAHPQRLAAAEVRSEAYTLLTLARAQTPSGPQLRAQTAQLTRLLPEFDKPVHLALESDEATQVAIPRVGSFGTFARREIELKPGRYTVIGTRAGYRDVRRDVTISPGEDTQTISVRCVEPI